MTNYGEWQPAITAPDDEEVLVWVENDEHKSEATPKIGYKEIAYKDAVGDQYWWIYPSGISIERNGYRVTHWMPLPPPPETSDGR